MKCPVAGRSNLVVQKPANRSVGFGVIRFVRLWPLTTAVQSYASFPLATRLLSGLLNSECSQQNRADEYKHGAYRQHIEIQGKVIGLNPSKHGKLPFGRRETAPTGSRGRSGIGTRTVHADSGTEA
jgi:hypothetical protein